MKVMQERIAKMIAAEEARADSAETRMVDALEGASAGVFLLREDGRVVFANTAAKMASLGEKTTGSFFGDILSGTGIDVMAVATGAEVRFERAVVLHRALADGGRRRGCCLDRYH